MMVLVLMVLILMVLVLTVLILMVLTYIDGPCTNAVLVTDGTCTTTVHCKHVAGSNGACIETV